jgi:hypothetical protein
MAPACDSPRDTSRGGGLINLLNLAVAFVETLHGDPMTTPIDSSNADRNRSDGTTAVASPGSSPMDAASARPAAPLVHIAPDVAGPTTLDPFDPARYRLSADYATTLGVKKVLTNIKCRKPVRQEWVRVHTAEDHQFSTMLFEDKIQREVYLVDPDAAGSLVGETFAACLVLAVSAQHTPFIWVLKLPGPEGNDNTWNDSARKAAELAKTKWVRLAANMSAGMYDVYEAEGELPDPVFPDMPFDELLRLAFQDRIIRGPQHPLIKRLRGEA